MRIGIDARFWSQTGIGRHIRNVVAELARLDANNQYVVFLLAEDFDHVALPSNFRKVKTNIRWHSFSEQLFLPFVYLREQLDILYSPHFNVPIFYPGKFVTTIHDLTVLRVRSGRVTTLPYPIYLVKYLAAFVVHLVAIKRSRKIFTVSSFVKNDIVKSFRVKPDKIVITPNAAGPDFYRYDESKVVGILTKYGIARPYLFYLGNAYPHKNLDRLIEAFGTLTEDFPNLFLVLAGKDNFFYARLEQESKSLDVYSRLVFTGYVDDNDLPGLYSGAEAFVNPSLYEGFGIQVLEAFSCGCKVVCSNTTSMPEVGGDLGRYFDPYNVKSIADAIKLTLSATPDDFATKARARAAEFSWEFSARAILETLRNV